MHQSAPVDWSQNSGASAYVGWDDAKIGKDRSSSKRRDDFALRTRELQNGFNTTTSTMKIINMVGTSLIIL
jgi:hypothetical protein